MKLLCLPFAGGNSYSYRDLAGELPTVEIVSLELPGRGRRTGEPLLKSLHAIIEDQLPRVRDGLTEPYCLYGHSMGAALAYLLTLRLIEERLPTPECLFVSGRAGPPVPEPHRRHLLAKAEFVAMLRDLGGCPPEVLAEPELVDFVEPIIRADFEAVETYKYIEAAPLDIRVVVMVGEHDADVSIAAAQEWQNVTNCSIVLRIFSGGHFFIFDHWSEIARVVAEQMS